MSVTFRRRRTAPAIYGLTGAARMHEYVGDMNLFYKPTAHLTIVPSVRLQKEDTDANAGGFETLGANAPVPFTGTSSEGRCSTGASAWT